MNVTKTTHTSYWQKIAWSFWSLIFWFLLFIWSFVLLFWNEGRQDLSKIAINAIEVESWDEVSDNDFVAMYWDVKTDSKIWDEYIKSWKYLLFSRNVEMYSWKEISHTETKDNVWWSTDTTTTYSYEKDWTSSPADSSKFQEKWHNNPVMSIKPKTIYANNVKLWKYKIYMNKITLPWSRNLELDKKILRSDIVNMKSTWNVSSTWINNSPKTMTINLWNWQIWTIVLWEAKKTWDKKEEKNEVSLWNEQYIFLWKWDINSPKVWDVRISYSVIDSDQEALVFWVVKNDSVRKYVDTKWNEIYRMFLWMTKWEAIKTMHTEHVKSMWMFRIIWLIMMRVWLQMMLSLASALASVVPFLWKLTWWIVKVITFVVALSLSILTIILSMILHSIVALVIVLVIWLWIWWYLFMKNKEAWKWWKLSSSDKKSNLNTKKDTKWSKKDNSEKK